VSQDIEQLLPDVFSRATAALMKYKKGAHSQSEPARKRAKEILADDEATATAVFLATHQLIGNAFLAWEPESIWLELSDKGVDLSLENRDKLLATITIMHGDAFHWDALVFENTVEAFNNIPSAPDAIQEASPGEIAWGAFEAELLAQYAGYVGEYDYEPSRYTALSMHRDGLVVAPELLTFAQNELDAFNADSSELKASTISRWDKTDKTKLEDLDLEETPEDIQVARLAAIHVYLGDRAQRLSNEVEKL
jgi:hypothetical protein